MLNADALSQLRQLKTDIKESKVVLSGTVKATTGRFGFVALDEGRDVFLPPEEMQKVLPGDRVNITEQEVEKGKTQGVVDELLESSLTTFVGRYLVKGKGHFVVPETPGVNRWIFIPPKERMNARPDDFVYCQIHRHPIRDGKGQARIVRVIGKAGEPGIERAFTLATFDLPDTWPEPVQQHASTLGEESIAALGGSREDLTEVPYVTIDSPGTQDMDDALFAEPNATGWKLSIAIADPTAVIEPGSAAEAEALSRATAIYFPGEPLPMLPDTLSTRLCSLMPDVDRLALVCNLQVNNDGSLGDYSFHRATIRSRGKLSYELVNNVIEGREDDDVRALPETVSNSLDQLHQVATALRKWRREHALLSNDRPEFRLRLDENKRIRQIEPAVPNEAHRLVEECMVAANRCAADFLRQQEHGLFIQHPGLRDDRLDNIRALLEAHAPALASLDAASAAGFRELMKQAEQVEAEVPLKAILSRQLARAELSFSAAPHQGMGLEAYTTFTSPLRKFSDFYVHRLIKSRLWQEGHQALSEQALAALQAAQLRARQAANSLENWLKCEFAKGLGEEPMTGVISRTTPAGFFVRLDDNGLEGFVSCKTLDGKYSFDPVTLRLIHNKNGRIFQLEQPVTVTFADVDDERKQINFRLVADAVDAPAS
ncbi:MULTISPECIES: ribonuclease R family protein [Marinobacter]|uniref:exoribonuclease II n=1 Tax=Marinobacter profundi TaxID=2666256 RepID=A0A2G1UH67_9GAMM|nr:MULTISPECIES: VacB/RNase II family 3'-5' exoribonuclease [Marinobacter]MBD3657291.1 VacB/RNase II family 3'-5' exoribonuclease [Marinobacter sp.]PHQ13769.1 3'-5' exonuclease [Marinobacter profundi]